MSTFTPDLSTLKPVAASSASTFSPDMSTLKPIGESNDSRLSRPSTAREIGNTAVDVVRGVGKGLHNDAAGISSLLNKIPYVGETLAPKQGVDAYHDAAKSSNTGESVGKGVEQGAEFFLPGGLEEKAGASALKLAPKLGQWGPRLARVATSALGTGAINKVQGGDFGTGAALGAGGSALGEVGRAVAPDIAEAALGIQKKMRAYGKTPGAAVLDEIKGISPVTIERNAIAKSKGLTDEIEGMAGAHDAAHATPQPSRITDPSRMLEAPSKTVPLGEAPGPGEMPGGLYPAETRLSGSHTPFDPMEGAPSANVTEADLHDPQYLTSHKGPGPGPTPPIAGPGTMTSNRLPNTHLDEFGRVTETPKPTGPYNIPQKGTVDLQPTLDTIDQHIAQATRENNEAGVQQLQKVRDSLTKEIGTGNEIPSNVTARRALDLKRGVRKQFVSNWNPESANNETRMAAKGAGHNIDEALDSVLGPDFASRNQRISSLLPVAERAESTSRAAPLAQRVLGRTKAHTGAMVGAAVGGSEGYRHGGIKGGVVGGLAGLVAPELIADPATQMALARALYSGVPARAAIGGLAQIDRP
jgi:hypothetical protein